MKCIPYLQQFNIIIKYKKGVTNNLFYMLSRPPVQTNFSLLVAIIIQSLEPSKFYLSYEEDADFGENYRKLQ